MKLESLDFNKALQIHQELGVYTKTGEIDPNGALHAIVNEICPDRYTHSFLAEVSAFKGRFYKHFAEKYFRQIRL